MIKFEKVSFEQFIVDMNKNFQYPVGYLKDIYDRIKLPTRATNGSAGYDFYIPFDITLTQSSGYKIIPTGIRWVTDRDDVVLFLLPRSGLGFKYKMELVNTAGVIDSDYQYSDNEGHIMAKVGLKFSCDNPFTANLSLKTGDAFMQGIILPFIKVDNEDEIITSRNGGFGSTDTQKENILEQLGILGN